MRLGSGKTKTMLNLNPTSLGNDIFNCALASRPRFPLRHIKQGALAPSPGLPLERRVASAPPFSHLLVYF